MKSLIGLAVLFSLSYVASGQTQESRPVVLVTAANEIDASASSTGAATDLGRVAVDGGTASSSIYVHSEIWEVVRRFTEDCPAATFVTNPATPHSMTIHTDYEKRRTLTVGTLTLYQLALLDRSGNPLYVGKKKYLRYEIKPICNAIRQQLQDSVVR